MRVGAFFRGYGLTKKPVDITCSRCLGIRPPASIVRVAVCECHPPVAMCQQCAQQSATASKEEE